MFLLIMNLGVAYLSGFDLVILNEVAVKILTGPQLSEGFHSMMTDLLAGNFMLPVDREP